MCRVINDRADAEWPHARTVKITKIQAPPQNPQNGKTKFN